jgi:hypothetical protein
VRKYPSYKKILREVKKVMKISLVHTNEKKECTVGEVSFIYGFPTVSTGEEHTVQLGQVV